MCGIAGVVHSDADDRVDEPTLRRMAAAIRHRGPDGYGIASGPGVGLASTRLAIFDIPGGWQPLQTPSGMSTIVYNGEVYNHPELRAELESAGESFATTCDTEVVLRLMERQGLGALDRLNGQFAFAWWQHRERRLTLVRDRFGVRPLYFAQLADGSLVFSSEAKGIFASELVEPRIDVEGLDEIFTLWGAIPPRTAFAGVHQVPAGGVLVWERGQIVAERRWWLPDLPDDAATTASSPADLDELMHDSVRLRLRADVPVGTYLSGGLDSSVITSLAQDVAQHQLRTFSVAFHDAQYDERPYQEDVARAVGTDHHVVEVGSEDIAAALPDVVWHTEAPLVRTAPVPLFLLARRVREQAITVVATGEGADELFWGYELFREVLLRELAQSDPARAEAMLDKLYVYLGANAARRGPAFRRFLLETGDLDDPLSSHLTRAGATGAIKAFYRPEVAELVGADTSLGRLRGLLPAASTSWSSLERASWLEITTLLEPYLLAAQGDRVAMAHGVEGRYPFLDHRVFDHAVRLPATAKHDGVRDKIALRNLGGRVLPAEIAERAKQPYRAPGVAGFVGPNAPGWVEDLLSVSALDDVGIWDPKRVAGLRRRADAGKATGPREEMAFLAVLSTQLWHRTFIDDARSWPLETTEPRVRLELA